MKGGIETAEKPTAAMVLSIIGGIFILLGGVAFFALASLMQAFAAIPGFQDLPFDPTTLFAIMGAVGAIIGLVIIVGGALMYSRPQSSTLWGVLILLLAIVSLFTVTGGFFIGFILALIGGILGIAFKQEPSGMAPAAAPMPPPAAPEPVMQEPAPAPEESSEESEEM